MEEENYNENYLKTKKLQKPKLKDLCKYYQDKDSYQLLEDISPSKRKKFLKKIKDEQKIKYENSKNYNNQQEINNKKYYKLQKNKSCPKFNNIIQEDLTKNKGKDEELYNFNNNDIKNNNYYLNNNIELTNCNTPENTYKKKKIRKNNEDYGGDNEIFTRIVPTFENRLIEDKNDSLIPSLNDSLYNNNTYDIQYMKKNPKKSNFIYYKSKTPNKKCIFHNKKKKNGNDRNINNDNRSLYSEINNSNMNTNINGSMNEGSSSKRSDTSRKLSLLLKYGVKLDLNKDKKNDYIDLITLSDIKNMNSLNKLSLKKNYLSNPKNIDITNYKVIPNFLPSSSNTNNSNDMDDIPEKNKKIYSLRNNKFMENKKNEKYYKNTEPNNSKSYDCVIFKKKIGMKKKKRKGKRNKTSDIFNDKQKDDKGTLIKKENIRGGIVDLYPNRFKKNNLKEKEKILKSDYENDKIIENKKIIVAVLIIQKWWKRINYRFIKKIVIIQKVFRGHLYRNKNKKILKVINRIDKVIKISKSTITNKNNQDNKKFYTNKIYKKNKSKNIFISKDYYNISQKEIILIQSKLRDFLKLKNNKNSELNNYINYIPKDICNISKIYINNNNISEENNNDINLNNMEIRKNKNNLKTIHSIPKKKHRYTQSKLFKSDINKLLLNGSQNKYETKNYTFLKICNFKNILKEEDDENMKRPYTCEIMRKIKYTPDKRHLTPDIKRKNIRQDPNLRVIKVNDDQYLINNSNKNALKGYNRKNNFDKDNNNNNKNYKKNNINSSVNSNRNNNYSDRNREIKFDKYNKNRINNQKINNYNFKRDNNLNNDNEINNNTNNPNNDKNKENLGNNIKNKNNKKYIINYNDYYNEIIEKTNNYYNQINKYNKTKNNSPKIEKIKENENQQSKNNENIKNNDKYSNDNNKKGNNLIKGNNYNNTSFFESKNNKNSNNKLNKNMNNIINYNNLDNYKVYNSKYSKKPQNNIVDEKEKYEKKDNNNNSYVQSNNFKNNNITNYKPIQIIPQFQMNEIIIKKNPDRSIYSQKFSNNNKEEHLDKIILIQKNVRKFLEKIKPKIKNVKKTILQKKNSKENNDNNIENINRNDRNYENYQPDFYNNNAVYLVTNSKTNLSRAELREKNESSPIKKSPNIPEKKIIYNIQNNNCNTKYNLNYSPIIENNSIPNQNFDLENSKYKNESLKEYSDSLKTISAHNDNLESKKSKDSLVNNSLINMNSIASINNNIKNYIIKNNSINDSYSENSHSNIINEDNNNFLSSNRQQDTTTTKRRKSSTSLKSLKYKYNTTSYKEYLKYLLKENYTNYLINQLKDIGTHIKYYKSIYLIKMIEQRIVKVMKQFGFFILKGNGFIIKKSIFFNVLIKYMENKDIFINDNNDLSKLFNNNILYYYNIYNKYKYVPFIRPNDEKKLIETQLFNNDIDFNNLINFICKYLKIEKKMDDFSPELVKYYLMKRPLKNFNIFTITRYMNSLHYIIIFNSYNTKKIVNKKNEYRTYDNIIKNDILKSNNTIFNREFNKRPLSLDDNKSFNLKKINTFYKMKKKIGLNRDGFLNFGNNTYDINSYNLMNKKNIDSLVNREIVRQIYEDYNNNKKYMRRRSVHYESSNKFKLKRHVANLSSSNLVNAPFGNVRIPNNSLVKKKFIYMKRIDIEI